MSAYTASRPGAIVESGNHAGSNRSLTYGKTELSLDVRAIVDAVSSYSNVPLFLRRATKVAQNRMFQRLNLTITTTADKEF